MIFHFDRAIRLEKTILCKLCQFFISYLLQTCVSGSVSKSMSMCADSMSLSYELYSMISLNIHYICDISTGVLLLHIGI